jgi:hypothetical protein
MNQSTANSPWWRQAASSSAAICSALMKQAPNGSAVDDAEVLSMLREYNAGGRSLHRTQ